MRRFCGLVTMTTLLGLAPAAHAIPAMTRGQIIDRGQTVIGYPYNFGQGRWRADGEHRNGACDQGPGGWGADCSGFVAKAWNVPQEYPLNENTHPYSTLNFYCESTHWRQVQRSNREKADAFVYRTACNSSGVGHVLLYRWTDQWGHYKTLECRGCDYRCNAFTRTVGSAYKAIRRDNLLAAMESPTDELGGTVLAPEESEVGLDGDPDTDSGALAGACQVGAGRRGTRASLLLMAAVGVVFARRRSRR